MSFHREEAGFTLVETLIASAIVVASMGALLQLFASGLDRMYRVESVQHLVLVKGQILQEIRTMNPALQSEASGSIEGVSYDWKSLPYGSAHVISMDDSALRIQLYRIVVTLKGMSGDDGFEIVQLGWHKMLSVQ